METRIALRYSGPAVESGSMDVYDATGNMVAFSEFVLLAAKTEFGKGIAARAEVAGFDRGSFVTDLVFHVTGISGTIFSGFSADQLRKIIEDAFKLWKHLRGCAPRRVEPASAQEVRVTNNGGDVIQISVNSLTLVMSEKGSESVGRFVKQALSTPGVDRMELAAGQMEIISVTQEESRYFVPVAPSETVTDVVVRMSLMVEAPVFKDGNKWRFSDGQQSFFADLDDREFLHRVDAGERFGKGDILSADVRINQQQTGLKLSAERTIVRVYEHRMASYQMPLGSH
ncbi:MAG: hypothetical protein JWO52_7367 [Gammaproteobacteria bacterium]|jgi:hypothetical protein|nr:hypothetical protein [Gammaproteobacteria bacterium]